MNQFTLDGKVTHKFETQTFSSGFQKREFVVCTDDEKYPQEIKFEALKDKCRDLDDIALNSRVTVHFNLRGNEYKERFYVNLQSWRIEVHEQGDDQPPKGSKSFEEEDRELAAKEETDEIPF